jgi:carbon storage regulator
MLVLTRRQGEAVVINENIQVRVLAVSGNKVRLGITAPDDVSVDRDEVHNRRTGAGWLPDGKAEIQVVADLTS